MSMSNYFEDVLVAWWRGEAAWPSLPANWYVALHTADPGETGASEVPSTNGYARAAIPADTSHWDDSSSGNGTTANTLSVSFATPSGSGWGTVTHFSIWDAASGGNCWMIGALDTPRTILSGDPVTVASKAFGLVWA